MVNKIIDLLLMLPVILFLNGAVILIFAHLWKELINDK